MQQMGLVSSPTDRCALRGTHWDLPRHVPPAVDILKETHKGQHSAIRPARYHYHGNLLFYCLIYKISYDNLAIF